MTVLDHITETERTERLARLAALKAAETVLTDHEKARAAINKELHSVKSQAWRSKRKSFEAFVEGTPVSAPPAGRSERDLADALAGCEAQLLEDKDAVQMARGKLRAGEVAILRACANRLAAAVYVAHAQALRAGWIALAGANELLRSVTGSHDEEIVDSETWKLLHVPASKTLPALAAAGIDQGDNFHTRSIANEAASYSQTASAAADALQREITNSLGTWPFGSAPVVVPPLVFQAAELARGEADAAAHKSRRAAIAAAAERMGIP